MSNFIYAILFIGLVVIIGQYNKKIGLALAALVFLGSLIVNSKKFENVMNGGAKK